MLYEVITTRVFRNQPTGVFCFYETFHGQFSIYDGNNNFAGYRFKGAVDDQNVIMINSSVDHGITGNPDKEGGGWIGRNNFV